MREEFERADEMLKNGFYEEAVELLETILQENPDDTEALWRIGVAFTELNEPAKAMKALEYFFLLEEDNPHALEAYGCAQFKTGNYGAAKVFLEKAEMLNGTSASIQRNLGVVYNQLGELEKSYAALEKAYEINNFDYRTIYALATVYLFFRRYAEARTLFEKLLGLDIPNDFHELAREGIQKIDHRNG